MVKKIIAWYRARNRPVSFAEIEAWVDSMDEYSASCITYERHVEYMAARPEIYGDITELAW
jgi:hypothetical protein